MSKLRKRISALFLGIGIFTLPALPALAEEEREVQKDLAPIVESVQMLNGDDDRFDIAENLGGSGTLRVKLNYDMEASGLIIEDQDKLSIQLVPEDSGKDFITMEYRTSQLRVLEDNGVKIADLDLTGRRGVAFTFSDISASFQAEINMPFETDEDELAEYFERHEGESTVTFRYNLQYNGADTGRSLQYTLKKREASPVIQNFYKTSGTYLQEGELGQGNFLYNIAMGTKLKQSNEFLIYDTPDVNLSFDGRITVCVPSTGIGGVGNVILRQSPGQANNHYIEPGSMADEDKMEIFIYDIYYLTEDKGALTSRQAGYEEQTVMLPRKDTMTGADTLESMDTVTMPKNILVEKMSGEALTAEEQKIIDDNGGLYQTVGKGFKVRVKNFKGRGLSQGGYLTLVYEMNIKNNSPMTDAQGFPKYVNMASYYGQEIPTCTPDSEICEPITMEKTRINQIPTSSPSVTPGSITGEVDAYSKVNFTKVSADADGQPDMTLPLSGAVFHIYKAAADQSRETAVNKAGISLENLVTNEAGQLCLNMEDKPVVDLRLERGNYVFEEVSAPENFEIIQKETPFTVGFLANNLVIANTPKEEILYEAVYRFVSADEGRELPQAVLDLLPGKEEGISDGAEVIPKAPGQTEIRAEGGVWSFRGWDKDKDVIHGANIEFTGLWSYKENAGITEDPAVKPSDKPSGGGSGIPSIKPSENPPGGTGNGGNSVKGTGSAPKTGDMSNAGWSAVLLAMSVMGGGSALVRSRRLKRRKR